MSRLFYHVMQDNLGNLLFGVSGTMRLAGSGTLATIYGDEALTVILPNPMTNHPSYGSFKCYLPVGSYDFYMAKAGYTFETLTGLQGVGSMAFQNSNAVSITGGQIVGVTALNVQGAVGINTPASGFALSVDGTAGGVRLIGPVGLAGNPDATYALRAYAGLPVQIDGRLTLGSGSLFSVNNVQVLRYAKGTDDCLVIVPTGSDAGGGSAVMFRNVAGAIIGTITTNASATAYNTSSDARLKTDVHDLTGALDVVQALRPVNFRWKSDDTPGRGFVAEEVQAVIPDGVITGEKDAVEEDGSIRPQQIDHSKLVVYLVGACQELAAQVAALTARLEACGG